MTVKELRDLCNEFLNYHPEDVEIVFSGSRKKIPLSDKLSYYPIDGKKLAILRPKT